jgi:hypothetical protein
MKLFEEYQNLRLVLPWPLICRVAVAAYCAGASLDEWVERAALRYMAVFAPPPPQTSRNAREGRFTGYAWGRFVRGRHGQGKVVRAALARAYLRWFRARQSLRMTWLLDQQGAH